MLGADTLPVAFHDAVARGEREDRLAIALAPAKNTVVRNLEPGEMPRARFNWHDGDVWTYQVGSATEALVCEVDLLGQLRLRSRERSASMAFERDEDCFISYDVVGDRNSVLQLVRAALPRVPLEENPRLVWRDFVPIHAATPRLSLSELGVPLHGTTGLEVAYTMTQQGAHWVITGESIRRDRQGAPVLRTRVAFDHGAGPLAIEVSWRDQHRTATRLLADAPDVRREPQASRKNHEHAYSVAGHHRPFEPPVPLDHGHGDTPDRGSGRLSGVL
jgi:hypothetical protein